VFALNESPARGLDATVDAICNKSLAEDEVKELLLSNAGLTGHVRLFET
jgi:hypothetical protein